MRAAIVLGAIGMAMLLPLAGAQAQFWRAGPEVLVWHGTDTGGIIPWSCESEAVAREAAAGYCARFGKYGRITSVRRQYGNYISFNCLWSANVDRFSRPAVPVRSVCRGEPQHVLAK